MNVKSADGLKGVLIYNGHNNYWLRVNQPDGTFKDYSIMHCDLHVQILDQDAYLYERDGELYLDHSPETLGIRRDS